MEQALNELGIEFTSKPLLIGGQAMEYYGLRKSGDDTDFVVSKTDFETLSQKYPDNKKDLEGDLGIVKDKVEAWQSICLFDYDNLSQGAIDEGKYLVISLEKLLLLKALGMHKEKYHKDLELIVKKIFDIQYKGKVPELKQ